MIKTGPILAYLFTITVYTIESVESWTFHALNSRRFAYVKEKGRGYQTLMVDERKSFKMADKTF